MEKDELIYIFAKDMAKDKKISAWRKLGFSEEMQEELSELGFVFEEDNGRLHAVKTPPILSKRLILHYLKKRNKYICTVLESTPSTNDLLKDAASTGAPSYTFACAEHQSAGRGRNDRVFLSPQNNGIYLSLLLRPKTDLALKSSAEGVLVTACAAVAAKNAIHAVTGMLTGIKWVNDLYLNDKKICGILCEGVFDTAKKDYEYIVLGIGINLLGDFAGTEIESTAASLQLNDKNQNLCLVKNKIIAAFLNEFDRLYRKQLGKGKRDFINDYKNALFIIDKELDVISGENVRKATVIGLNDDFSLSVRYEDGSTESLISGEVRLKIKENTQ